MRSHHSINRTFAWSLFILLSLTLPLGLNAQEDIIGEWTGAIDIPGMRLDVTIDFTSAEDGSTAGTIDIPLQNARDLPLGQISVADRKASFAISGLPGNPTFNGTLSDDGNTLSGTFTQSGQNFPFSLTRVVSDASSEEKALLEERLEQLRTFIDSTMGTWNTPGLAMAIVKDDAVIFSEGFGYRDVANELPVTDQTLFAIGSSSKAFTAATVGLLVSDRVIEWDTPVRNYLPGFRLHNEYASDHMTPLDLLTHRSGLPRHDFIWYGSEKTREQLFSSLQYLEFSEDFRETWQYQNLMFLTAGYLVGQMSGSTWEDVVQTRLFDPLGMTNSNFSVVTMQESDDYALPYGVEDDAPVIIPYRNIDEMGPAGSINSSVSDMSNWVRIQLRNGSLGDTEIIPEDVINQMHRPHMVVPRGRSSTEYFHTLYGLGWFIEPYRGRMRIHHGGSIDGFQALVSFLPDDDIGMVVLTNRSGSPMPTFASLFAADLLLGLEPVDWHGRSLARRAAAQDSDDEDEDEDAGRVEGTDMSHGIEAYVGTYEHPAYGLVSIEEGDELTARFHGITFDLEHWHYDMFRGTGRNPGQMRMMFTFTTDRMGDVGEVAILLEPAVEPIVFSRKPSDALTDPAYLDAFVGEYELRGTIFTVAKSQPTVLTIAVPGQPTYTLEPFKENAFNLSGLNGYSVVFTVEDGVSTEIIFHQPNGVFPASRRQDQ